MNDGAPAPGEAGPGPVTGHGEPVAATGRRRPWSRRRRAVDLAVIAVCGILVATVVRVGVMQTFSIPSESMAPTLDVGDRIVVDKLTYRFREPRRFEIVVFRAPTGLSSDFRQLVKRVIGVPGDVVAPDGRGGVTVNGRPLVERYLPPGTPTEDLVRTVVPADSYLVLGDNRTASVDGRFFGTVARDEVIGRAVLRVWPVGRFGRP